MVWLDPAPEVAACQPAAHRPLHDPLGLRPRHRKSLDPAPRALQPRNSRMHDGRERAGVQMPPVTLLMVVDRGALLHCGHTQSVSAGSATRICRSPGGCLISTSESSHPSGVVERDGDQNSGGYLSTTRRWIRGCPVVHIRAK